MSGKAESGGKAFDIFNILAAADEIQIAAFELAGVKSLLLAVRAAIGDEEEYYVNGLDILIRILDGNYIKLREIADQISGQVDRGEVEK